MATERYTEPEEDESAPWREQEGWEDSQIAKASQRYGAKDKARGKAEQYDFVFEDQIDFIKDEYLAGQAPNLLHPPAPLPPLAGFR